MREVYLKAVVDLEQGCHLNSRGEASYRTALQDSRSVLLVVLSEGTSSSLPNVIAIFSALAVVDELQIDNIAVVEGYRQQGVGTILIMEALKIAKEKGMESAVLEVRSNNLPALKFYKGHGFSIIGRRKDYYQNPPDDALIMSLNIGKRS